MKLDKTITKRQYWFVIIMIFIWLSFSIGSFIYFKKQCEMARENPLTYVANKYDIEYCSCNTQDGNYFHFNKSNAWIERRQVVFDVDLNKGED